MDKTTTDTDANALIVALVSRLRAALGEHLIGLYLYGSLVTGDYDAGVSDIDLLAAVASDLRDDEFAALDAQHRQLVSDFPHWEDRIEIAYLSLDGLRTFKTRRSPIAVISPGEPFNRKTAGADWLMNWHVVREDGVTLYGPPPQQIITPTTSAERAACVRGYALDAVSWLDDTTHRGFQAYSILTMCRALYTLTTGDHISKRAAAEWTAARLPEWAGLIERALVWRQVSRTATGVDDRATLDTTRRFMRALIEQIRALPLPDD